MLLIDWVKLELRRRVTKLLLAPSPSRRKKTREKREKKEEPKINLTKFFISIKLMTHTAIFAVKS
jgi:hypothetical protein